MPDVFDKVKKGDIFDTIVFAKKEDVFDKVKVLPPPKKAVELKVVQPVKKEDIFDRIDKQIAPILKKYIKPDKKEVDLSKEIVKLVRAEISKIPPLEKVIEKKVIEKQIVKEVEKVEKPKEVVDETSRVQIEELIGRVKGLEGDLSKEKGKAQVYTIPIRLPEQMGNGGKFLKTNESGGGSTMKWQKITEAFGDIYFESDQGLVFKTPDGNYYLLNIGNGGVIQSTPVTP